MFDFYQQCFGNWNDGKRKEKRINHAEYLKASQFFVDTQFIWDNDEMVTEDRTSTF